MLRRQGWRIVLLAFELSLLTNGRALIISVPICVERDGCFYRPLPQRPGIRVAPLHQPLSARATQRSARPSMRWCFSLHKFQPDIYIYTQIFQNCHGSLLEVAFPIKRLERLWQEKRRYAKIEKQPLLSSSVMFKPLMLLKNLSLMDLDLSIYGSTHVFPLFQHDHPAALNLCKWDLNRVASPFFWHGGLGTAVVLRGRKTPPTLSNGLLSINISNSLDISWFTLPQTYSINAAKGFSSVLHISGACSHCSHCHLSAVYPSSHRTAGTSSTLSGAAPPADVTTASKPFPLGQEQSFWMLEVSRVQGFKGNPRVNDHDMQWWQWYSYDHLDISYLSIKSPAAHGDGVEVCWGWGIFEFQLKMGK